MQKIVLEKSQALAEVLSELSGIEMIDELEESIEDEVVLSELSGIEMQRNLMWGIEV